MFKKLAATITRNARGYRTKLACELAIHRVRAAYVAAGSYGCDIDKLRDAIAACQDRLQELRGIEWDARFATN